MTEGLERHGDQKLEKNHSLFLDEARIGMLANYSLKITLTSWMRQGKTNHDGVKLAKNHSLSG